MKVHCPSAKFEQEFSVYGHYQFTDSTQNPNQLYITLPKNLAEQQFVSGFLVKDIGELETTIALLKSSLGESFKHLTYTKKQLSSYRLFTFIVAIGALAAAAVLLVLSMPLSKIMLPEIFLIKLYGGRYQIIVLVAAFLVFVTSTMLAWAIGEGILEWINRQVLTPFAVPLMRFESHYFYSGAALIAIIWCSAWLWLVSQIDALLLTDG